MTVMKAPFLKMSYGAYHHRDVPPEDAELTHVGPHTPCGEYLRRFWHPVAFSEELRELPKKVRVMGEDLVVFRDKRGRVGLLELHCSHRGTSLEFGVICETGIRCCYHGWLFDVDGTVLETPAEPEKSTFRNRLYHGAYPTVEYNGLVFAYMGPPERKPPFPIFDTYQLPGYRCLAKRRHVIPCNWLQVKENCMDPAHLSFLHTIVSGAQFTPEFGILPPTEFPQTSCGMAYITPRRVGENIWVRIADFIPPNIHQFPPVWEDGKQEKVMSRPYMTIWAVPVDDTTTINTGFLYLPKDMQVDEKRMQKLIDSFGQTGDRPYEERQRQPGDYDAQTTQRPIAVHAMERLTTSDRGIIMLRKMIREGIRAVASGKDPYGVGRDNPIRTYSQDTVVRVPYAGDPDADTRLLVETGRKVLEGFYLKHPPDSVTPEMLHNVGF